MTTTLHCPACNGRLDMEDQVCPTCGTSLQVRPTSDNLSLFDAASPKLAPSDDFVPLRAQVTHRSSQRSLTHRVSRSVRHSVSRLADVLST